MSIKDLPIVVFSEEELKHLQQMAGGDGDECPIPLGEENENLKKMSSASGICPRTLKTSNLL